MLAGKLTDAIPQVCGRFTQGVGTLYCAQSNEIGYSVVMEGAQIMELVHAVPYL